MTVVQTLRRSEAVNFDFDGLIAAAEPLYCKAFRKVLDPMGGRFT
jgi:beta-phosphoglucomutase-like phosphatase (HAD superfamily)